MFYKNDPTPLIWIESPNKLLVSLHSSKIKGKYSAYENTQKLKLKLAQKQQASFWNKGNQGYPMMSGMAPAMNPYPFANPMPMFASPPKRK